MKKVLTLCLLCLMVASAWAIPVGSWRSHYSYSNVTMVEETPNKVFAIGDGHLFFVNKGDGSVDTFNKIDGLSDNSVACMSYSWSAEMLVIAYRNANIDLIDTDGNIYNIPYVMDKSLAVDKTIHSICFYGTDAYICTSFGVVVLNLKKREVKNTFIIGDAGQMSPVYSITQDGTAFYALMDGVIKTAPVKGKNLLDYRNWVRSSIELPIGGNPFTALHYFGDKFIVSQDKGPVYQFDGEGWSVLCENTTNAKCMLHRCGDFLTAVCGQKAYKFSWSWDTFISLAIDCSDLVSSADNEYWMAGYDQGIYKYDGKDITYFKASGPFTSGTKEMYYDQQNDRVVVAPGNAWIARMLDPGAIEFYENGKWTSYTALETGAKEITPDGFFFDVVSVAVDPKNPNHWFAATWGEGIYEFLDGKAVKLYNYFNTDGVIKPVAGLVESDWNHYTRVDALSYGPDGNLWAICSIISPNETEDAVVYMTPDGVWHSASGYSPVASFSNASQMLFHSNGQQWIRSSRYKPGILIKGDNNSTKFIGSFVDKDGKYITPSFIYDMAEDKEGTVWVATSEGPILFQNPKNVFTSTYRVSRIKIPRDDGTGLADYLLDGIVVRSVAVDGGNRKWLGTENAGVYLISADGMETIYHFTTENSPLPSNEVVSILVNPKSGSVFFGTADGIIEYGEGMVEPVKKMDSKKIYVYPNPVTPEYTGMITVVGLEAGTVVKVCDASGYVVFEGKSTGGSLSWDGRDHMGSYVASGVYFFHLMNTDENNSRSAAAKVLIIR